jgi:DnaJ like chaperone protein
MQWTGKIIGALLGFVIGRGLFGGLLGALIGNAYDTWRAHGGVRAGFRPHGDPAAIQNGFFATVFAVMGHLAKADGRVSEAEVAAARAVMRDLGLNEAHVGRAIDAYTRGKAANYPLASELSQLAALCAARRDLLWVFLELQVRAALMGNDLSGPVRALLGGVAERLGFDAAAVSQIEAALRMQRGRGGTQSTVGQGERVRGAYSVLGVDATASDETVKKAYRRLMSENHPDKLVARGLPESMQALATEKTQRIREAYETICEYRRQR